MSDKIPSLTEMNVQVVKSVLRKVVNNTSYNKLPFKELNFSMAQNLGYGFTLNDYQKFLAVRASSKLVVYINNSGANYKKTFVICDTDKGQLSTDAARKSYEKYCVTSIISIIQEWEKSSTPKLGEETLYKF